MNERPGPLQHVLWVGRASVGLKKASDGRTVKLMSGVQRDVADSRTHSWLRERLSRLPPHALLDIATAACRQDAGGHPGDAVSFGFANRVLASYFPTPEWIVSEVLLSLDLMGRVAESVSPAQDGFHFALVCRTWADIWKATVRACRYFVRTTSRTLPAARFMLPPVYPQYYNGVAVLRDGRLVTAGSDMHELFLVDPNSCDSTAAAPHILPYLPKSPHISPYLWSIPICMRLNRHRAARVRERPACTTICATSTQPAPERPACTTWTQAPAPLTVRHSTHDSEQPLQPPATALCPRLGLDAIVQVALRLRGTDERPPRRVAR